MKKVVITVFFAGFIAFAFPQGNSVSASTLADQLSWLRGNAADNIHYIIGIHNDETIASQTLPTGRSNTTITLRGIDGMRTINLSGAGSLFTVDSGTTLILDSGITLKGNEYSSQDYLIRVNDGGTLIMNGGKILNHETARGGGVFVASSGTFTIHDGAITVLSSAPRAPQPAPPPPVQPLPEPEPEYIVQPPQQVQPEPQYVAQPEYHPEPEPQYVAQPEYHPEPEPQYVAQPEYHPEPEPQYIAQPPYEPPPAPVPQAQIQPAPVPQPPPQAQIQPAPPPPPPEPQRMAHPAVIVAGMIPDERSPHLYRIQVGAFEIPWNAVQAFNKLRDSGLDPRYERYGGAYRVVLPWLRADQIQETRQTLGNAGFREVIIRQETGY